MIVLDSSAMLAYLRSEIGGDWIRDLLLDEERDVPIYAHSVNLCEVFYDAWGRNGRDNAEASLQILRDSGIIARQDMDIAFWQDVAFLINTQRRSGNRLALGDAFGLALARREQCDFYTSDRGELEAVRDANLCEVTFIR